MNAKIFNIIVAKEWDKLAALPPISPAASAQMKKIDQGRQMSKMVKSTQPVRPSYGALRPSKPKMIGLGG